MAGNHIVRKVDDECWKQAQAFEAGVQSGYLIDAGDDWNDWWKGKFDDYSSLAGRSFDNVLEVGCGPHTNLRHILPLIACGKIWLEDPLIQLYVTRGFGSDRSIIDKLHGFIGRSGEPSYCMKLFADTGRKADLSSAPLESLPYRDGQMDLAVCINVLDHVRDFDLCMGELHRVLRENGILVIGQDLSNAEDLESCPESYEDRGHPIKVDHVVMEESIAGRYDKLMYRLLPREEGRNPAAHYATCLAVLKKTGTNDGGEGRPINDPAGHSSSPAQSGEMSSLADERRKRKSIIPD